MSDRWITLLIALVSSGLIQYFFNYWTSKHDKYAVLKGRIEQVNVERENKGKERYDENKEAIEELRKAVIKICETQEAQNDVAIAHSELLIGLAQDRLVFLTDRYIKRGMITLDELAVIEDIYTPYHDKLGGNGRGKAGIEKCRTLPVVDETIVMLKEKEEKENDKQGL